MYIAGYIHRKLKTKFPDEFEGEQKVHSAWISLKSRGGLTQPTVTVADLCDRLNNYFVNFHGDDINREPMPLERLKDIVKSVEGNLSPCLDFAVSLYIKIRFFNRLKMLNNRLKTSDKREKIRKLKQLSQHMF